MGSQIETWREAIENSLMKTLNGVASVLPNIIGALIVLIIGLLLAGILGRLVSRFINFTKLDTFLNKTVGLNKLKQRGININAADLVGRGVKWFFIIITFIAIADILKWSQLTRFFESVALYIPNVIVTILILLAGFILGGGLREIVVRSVEASGLENISSKFIGTVANWSVIIFAIMASLTQLGIAEDLIKILFTGFIAMVSLAGGLSFGLGGRDKVTIWLNKVLKK